MNALRPLLLLIAVWLSTPERGVALAPDSQLARQNLARALAHQEPLLTTAEGP